MAHNLTLGTTVVEFKGSPQKNNFVFWGNFVQPGLTPHIANVACLHVVHRGEVKDQVEPVFLSQAPFVLCIFFN